MKLSSRAGAFAVALVLNTLASTALAADPVLEGQVDRPPTRAEQKAADAKLRAAARYLATQPDGSGLAATAVCPDPLSVGEPVVADEAAPAGDVTALACGVPSGALAVEARDQIFGHYCGPAVGQVISNYAWAMSSGWNKYTQQQIAAWMNTDNNGGTSSWWMANGLTVATNWSPRRPAGFVYVAQGLVDSNGSGTAGDEWHGFVRYDISHDRMPLAVSLKPHQPYANVWLTSWPVEVWSVGHWIGVYGWYGLWNGGDFPRVYYTDSSRDEGGSTGKFSDPSRHVYLLISWHTNIIVW